VFVVGVAASAFGVWKIASADGVPRVVLGKVTAIENLPKNPIVRRDDSRRDIEEKIGRWYLAFFEDTRIIIDQGLDQRVRRGDFFATVYNPERADDLPQDAIGNLQDELTALIRVGTVYSDQSVGRLHSYAYEAHLRRLPDAGNIPEEGGVLKLTSIAPVTVGLRVVAVPRDEKAALDAIEEDLAEADKATGKMRRSSYERALGKIEDFEADYPNGFFTGDVIFDHGSVLFHLGDYRGAIRTFERFRERYPFHPSAGAVQDWIDRAQQELEGRTVTASPGGTDSHRQLTRQ
jgi:Outer membrane lipoprotein